MAERIQLKGEKKMLRVAEFQKVSTKQFVNAMAEVKPEIAMFDASDIWDKLKLPRRATKGSAGYDFYAPYDITLSPGQSAKVPTGIRAKM